MATPGISAQDVRPAERKPFRYSGSAALYTVSTPTPAQSHTSSSIVYPASVNCQAVPLSPRGPHLHERHVSVDQREGSYQRGSAARPQGLDRESEGHFEGRLALAGADRAWLLQASAVVLPVQSRCKAPGNRSARDGKEELSSIDPSSCGAIRFRRITPPEGLRSCGSGPSKPGRLGGEPLRVPVAEPIALFATGGDHARIIAINF
jgi:hypothetical protein